MIRHEFRDAFVLPLTLVMCFAVAVVISSICGYVSWAGRQTRMYMALDRCRFAAQSAIEEAKMDIQQGFTEYLSANFASIQIAPGKAKAYNWFNTVSGDHRTIGNPTPATIFPDKTMPLTINGCSVWVGIGKEVDHPDNASEAIVPIVATAEYKGVDGQVMRSTIQERIVFGTGQSKVFDNAYFVNNYGWMSGPFTINGEFRANGNVSLKSSGGAPVVNGFVYAARNTEIGAEGDVTVSGAQIWNQSKYRQSASTRARYDIGNLDDIGVYDYVSSTASISRPTSFDSDGNALNGTKTATTAKSIVNEDADPVEMPFVADLDPYIEYAMEQGGTLRYPSTSYTDGGSVVHKNNGGTVSGYFDGPGPSAYDSNGALIADRTTDADDGSLVLVGTQSNPIVIDGPVVVAGDVIIKGYVKGQGTIYAGRNVHVIGDIKYVNAPSWTHSASTATAEQEHSNNESKDMLGIVAKGNIVIGDATSSSIAQNVNSGDYKSYACDASDSSIGYPSTFAGDYRKVEKVSGLSSSYANEAPGGYDTSTGQFGKIRDVSVTEQVTTWVDGHYEYSRRGRTWVAGHYETKNVTTTTGDVKYNRCYYETICDNRILSAYRSTVSTIDAVMYNNHGVFGSLGASFNINGALVCRDEGLTANGGSFNWDMRLRRKKDSSVVKKMGLPKGAGDPYTVDWVELHESMNPVYVPAGEATP